MITALESIISWTYSCPDPLGNLFCVFPMFPKPGTLLVASARDPPRPFSRVWDIFWVTPNIIVPCSQCLMDLLEPLASGKWSAGPEPRDFCAAVKDPAWCGSNLSCFTC